MSATKSYDEIIDFIAAGTTPETVVAFRPSDSVQERVAELVELPQRQCLGRRAI
jgi:HKD family nuclease